MKGAMPESPSSLTHATGWNIETVLLHLTSLLAEADRRYEQRFDAQEQAVAKTEDNLTRRFEGVNEFRAQLADQQRTFIPRAEVEVMRGAMEAKVNDLKERVDAIITERQGIKGGWGYAVAVIGFVSLLVGLGMALMAAFKP